MKKHLKSDHQSFLISDILNWSVEESQLDIFIENIEFIPFNGKYVEAIISYNKI